MVVDDELSMREVLELMLAKEGYQITCAENGRKAIELLEKDQYDLMLCDIKLGDISGLDVLQASKKTNPDTVVILISAYASTETAVEAMNAGAYDYVPKPFDKDEFLAEPHFPAANIQLGGDRPVLWGVFRHVGVEEKDGDSYGAFFKGDHRGAYDLRAEKSFPVLQVHVDHRRDSEPPAGKQYGFLHLGDRYLWPAVCSPQLPYPQAAEC